MASINHRLWKTCSFTVNHHHRWIKWMKILLSGPPVQTGFRPAYIYIYMLMHPRPLQARALSAGFNWWGERFSQRSRPKRADAQRLVTTRLLDHLHDPLAATRSSAEDPSPRALKWQSVDEVRRFLHHTHGQPVKVQGQRPIRIRLRRAGSNHHVPARILT